MIRINLLPEEYRKKARTPVKLLLAVAGAVALNAALLAWWGWASFGVASEIESEKQTLQLEMDGLAPQVAYYQSLDAESKQHQSRETTLSQITKSRISWTRKLDELVDVVNRGGDGQRHLVWFDDLQVSQTDGSSGGSGKTYGSVRANGHSGSDKFAQVANFLEDVEASPFISDFQPPAPPEGTQTLTDETLMPPVAWSFPLSLSLKSPEDRGGPDAKTGKDAAGKNAGAKHAGASSDGAKSDAAKTDGAKNAPAKSSASAPDPEPAKPAATKSGTEARQ
jgi:Tfp pilus assembly protein PilN